MQSATSNQSAISNYQLAISPVLPTLCLLLAVACSSGSEQFILGEFFAACRLRDRTALQGFATVPFEPHLQGIVTSFTIARVSPEEYRPLSRVASEIGIAELSVDDPRHPIDLRRSGGEMVSKEVTIRAPIQLPDGQIARKTMNIILQRAILKGDRAIAGRWIVTGFTIH
jgi:hypothetical protein